MLSLTDSDYYKRRQKFEVLNKSISVISDYYEVTTEDKEKVLRQISDAIKKMYYVKFVYNVQAYGNTIDSPKTTFQLMNSVQFAFLTELKQIQEVHKDEAFIQELITRHTKDESTGGCYVATAVYGSYDCPQVWTLRRFRDYTLAETWYGRAFIKAYYAVSPTLVKWFGHTKWFKRMWKGKLDSMVAKLNAEGVEDTPYQDKTW